MSVEKSAAFFNRIQEAVRAAKPIHELAGKDKGFSLASWLLDAAEHNGAIGAKSLRRGYEKMQYGLSQADTALGAALRGDAKPGTWRHSMFTTKKKIPVKEQGFRHYVPDTSGGPGSGMYKEMEYASGSEPIKALAGPVATGLALTKADEIINSMQKKTEERPQ